MTAAQLLACAAIVHAAADRQGQPHWIDLADRLTTAATNCTCNEGETHE